MDVKIQLVILDWAGTTIDYGCMAPSGAFVAVFAQFGVPVSLAEARGPMGLHKKDHLRAMLSTPEIGRRWHETHGKAWNEDDVLAMYQVVTPMQVQAAKDHSDLIPGTLEGIARLRSMGLKIGATTGYFHEAAQAVYQAAAEQGYSPDFRICADEVPAGRPAPWMIFRTMEALGVYPPCAVVKVGDTVVDIRDGINAGVWSVGVIDCSNEMGLTLEEFNSLSDADREQRRKAVKAKYDETGAHGTVNTLKELPELIERLQLLN